MAEHISKEELLKDLNIQISKWKQLKGQPQDVTYENFIDDVILVYSWVIDDVIRME